MNLPWYFPKPLLPATDSTGPDFLQDSPPAHPEPQGCRLFSWKSPAASQWPTRCRTSCPSLFLVELYGSSVTQCQIIPAAHHCLEFHMHHCDWSTLATWSQALHKALLGLRGLISLRNLSGALPYVPTARGHHPAWNEGQPLPGALKNQQRIDNAGYPDSCG